MQCTTCKSDNVQRLSVVYDHGTQDIETVGRTTGSAIGIGRGGLGVGMGSATTSTTGTAQTRTAQRAAPPMEKPYRQFFLSIALGLILFFAIHITLINVIGVGIIGFSIFKLWTHFQYNRNVYPGLVSKWHKSWLCNKCGAIYLQ